MRNRWLRSRTLQGARRIAGVWTAVVCLSAAAWAQSPTAGPLPGAATIGPDPAFLLPGSPGLHEMPLSLLTDVPIRDQFAITAPSIGTTGTRPFGIRNFGDRLMARMEREARRSTHESLLTITDQDDAPDSVLEGERAGHAERIIGRAMHRSLDDQMEQVARTAWGLGPVIDWMEDLGRGRGSRSQESAGAPFPTAGSPATRGFDGSVGVRIGAHPRVVLRGVFGGLSGRIDVPLLEDEIRVSLERPIGPHGRAAVVGTFQRGEPGQAYLSFNFGF